MAGLTGPLSGGLGAGLRPADINSSNVAADDYDQLYADSLGAIGEITSNFDYNKLVRKHRKAAVVRAPTGTSRLRPTSATHGR